MTADAARALVYVLVAVEWILGVMLISGWRGRVTLILAGGLTCLLTLFLTWLQSTGFSGDCGCGGVPLSIPNAIIRNGLILAAIGVALVVTPGIREQHQAGAQP